MITYQELPSGTNGVPELTPFQNLVSEQITGWGDDNTPDPHWPHHDSYNENGSTRYSSLWQTHHLLVASGVQTVYAFRPAYRLEVEGAEAQEPKPQVGAESMSRLPGLLAVEAVFVVNRLDESGVVEQTRFTDDDDGGIFKMHATNLAETLRHTGVVEVDFFRSLDDQEQDNLHAVLADPKTNIAALQKLVSLTAVEASVAKAAMAARATAEGGYAATFAVLDTAGYTQIPPDKR